MTGAELKTMVESMVDDNLDSALFYNLLNTARIDLEESRDWSFLSGIFTDTRAGGDTYTTLKDLPSETSVVNSLHVGTDTFAELQQIPLEQREQYKDVGVYYIDHVNQKYGICGSADNGENVKIYYQKTSSNITDGTSWVAPERFHSLLAYDVAYAYLLGADNDSINARKSIYHREERARQRGIMEGWDTELKLKAINGTTPQYVN